MSERVTYRYDMAPHGDCMERHPLGKWVKAEDWEAMRAERDEAITALCRIKIEACCPAAEYVPALGAIIDMADKAISRAGGTSNG